jgi:hypothetical protein
LRRRLIHPEVEDQTEAELVPAESRLARVGDLVVVEFKGVFDHPERDAATYKRFAVKISRPLATPTETAPPAADDEIPF